MEIISSNEKLTDKGVKEYAKAMKDQKEFADSSADRMTDIFKDIAVSSSNMQILTAPFKELKALIGAETAEEFANLSEKLRILLESSTVQAAIKGLTNLINTLVFGLSAIIDYITKILGFRESTSRRLPEEPEGVTVHYVYNEPIPPIVNWLNWLAPGGWDPW